MCKILIKIQTSLILFEFNKNKFNNLIIVGKLFVI